MIHIYVYGNGQEDFVGTRVSRALSRYGKVKYEQKTKNITDEIGGNSFDYWIIDCTDAILPEYQTGIVLLKNSFVPSEHFKVPNGWVPVLESRNTRVKEILGPRSDIITCGTAATDTVSMASLSDENGTVTLQKPIETIDGSLMEPREILVCFSGTCSPHQILPVVSVLLLCNLPSEEGYFL